MLVIERRDILLASKDKMPILANEWILARENRKVELGLVVVWTFTAGINKKDSTEKRKMILSSKSKLRDGISSLSNFLAQFTKSILSLDTTTMVSNSTLRHGDTAWVSKESDIFYPEQLVEHCCVKYEQPSSLWNMNSVIDQFRVMLQAHG